MDKRQTLFPESRDAESWRASPTSATKPTSRYFSSVSRYHLIVVVVVVAVIAQARLSLEALRWGNVPHIFWTSEHVGCPSILRSNLDPLPPGSWSVGSGMCPFILIARRQHCSGHQIGGGSDDGLGQRSKDCHPRNLKPGRHARWRNTQSRHWLASG